MSSSEDEYHAKSDKLINSNPLPYKSKERYIAAYENFIAWKNEKNITSFSENTLITYFDEISTKYKPPSLWAIYSMLKNTLKSKHNVNLEGYVNLTSYLKTQSNGYVGKKSKVLTVENVETFIDQAPDDKYLVIKVALILGVTGGLRSQELSRITVDQIENHGEMCLVTIPNAENKLPRTFVIQGKYYNIMKRYQNLRSNKADSNRFFQHYRNGKCSSQVMGKNRFGNMPKEIAEFLKLPDADLYTGHTFRRTSTSLLGDGGDLASKRQKPSTVDLQEHADLDYSDRSKVSERPIRPLARCCFCGEFTKKYVNVVVRPYISENRTTLAINNLNVELDFNGALPKTVCVICDKKLKGMLDFVKLVKFAHETLLNAETRPIETVTVKNERKSKDDIDDIDNDDTKDEDNEINSMALCETVYENQDVNRKRKSNSDTSKTMSKRTKESEQYDFFIEVKPEPIENDSTIEIEQEAIRYETVNSDLINYVPDEAIGYDGSKEIIDTGTEVTSSETELTTNALVNATGDDYSYLSESV